MIQPAISDARTAARNAARILRVRDWWSFKLPPALAIFYGALLSRDAGLLSHLTDALLLLAALAACAGFVSILNDLCDIRADAMAGKPNRMTGRSDAAKTALVLLPVLAGAGAAAVWRHAPPLAACYTGSFLAFILYSVRPIRLKDRGAAGATADAAGAHLFPTLTAALLGLRDAGGGLNLGLLTAAAAWALALGLRGIMWHQLGDVAADRLADAGTLPMRHGTAALIRVGERILFPVELIALAGLLWTMHAALAFLLLAPYLLALVAGREHMPVAIAAPRPRTAIAFQDYYATWLPAGIIVQSAIRHPADLLLLCVQVALFPALAAQFGLRAKLLLERGRAVVAR